MVTVVICHIHHPFNKKKVIIAIAELSLVSEPTFENFYLSDPVLYAPAKWAQNQSHRKACQSPRKGGLVSQ